MNNERFNGFFEAVDTVCMECAFQDEECNECPVWKTCEAIRKLQDKTNVS